MDLAHLDQSTGQWTKFCCPLILTEVALRFQNIMNQTDFQANFGLAAWFLLKCFEGPFLTMIDKDTRTFRVPPYLLRKNMHGLYQYPEGFTWIF